jgi:hypothetical protein
MPEEHHHWHRLCDADIDVLVGGERAQGGVFDDEIDAKGARSQRFHRVDHLPEARSGLRGDAQHPSPPAFDTAATKAGSAKKPIPAEINGTSSAYCWVNAVRHIMNPFLPLLEAPFL